MIVVVVQKLNEKRELVEEWLTLTTGEYEELLALEERGELIAVLRVS